ncbi:hypothetical protein LCGC14_3088240 [marine sediment metagenome]|uniref:Uncharacterized protein n=1 Tax=marine sediment metagenome TaxID=412755 RepID=A0A0F8WB79_9ZZZZ
MTDKLRTFECRCRGRIQVESEEEARIALDVSSIILSCKPGHRQHMDHTAYIRITNIEVLGEVQEE